MRVPLPTKQDNLRYEDAIARHAQHVRWMRAVQCPCLNSTTSQPNPRCTLCGGRGKLYQTPGNMHIRFEIAAHNAIGVITPAFSPVVQGTVSVWHRQEQLTLSATQPADGRHVLLERPFPKIWERLTMEYEFNPTMTVSGENSTVCGTNTLRVVAPRFRYLGKDFTGSLTAVTQVRNVTKSETYTVVHYAKDYIYLSGMGTWASGDVLSVNYQYVQPFQFVINGITARMRYESPNLLPEAQSVLITPYWAQVGPDDLITALSSEQFGSAVIDPRVSVGNDAIKNYYDVSKVLDAVDITGTKYVAGTNFELYGRNEVRWLTTKPTQQYTIQFMYHPTYIALKEFSTMRSAENKAFANKISLMQYDMVNTRRPF